MADSQTCLDNDAKDSDDSTAGNDDTNEEVPKGIATGFIEALSNKTVEKKMTLMYEKSVDKKFGTSGGQDRKNQNS